MKIILFAALALAVSVQTSVADVPLPHVGYDTSLKSFLGVKGKTLAEILPADTVKRIVIKMTSSALAGCEQPANDDVLFSHLYNASEKAEDFRLAANEFSVAEFLVFQKDGTMFLFEIIGGHSKQEPLAVLITGPNWSARVPIVGLELPAAKRQP